MQIYDSISMLSSSGCPWIAVAMNVVGSARVQARVSVGLVLLCFLVLLLSVAVDGCKHGRARVGEQQLSAGYLLMRREY